MPPICGAAGCFQRTYDGDRFCLRHSTDSRAEADQAEARQETPTVGVPVLDEDLARLKADSSPPARREFVEGEADADLVERVATQLAADPQSDTTVEGEPWPHPGSEHW